MFVDFFRHEFRLCQHLLRVMVPGCPKAYLDVFDFDGWPDGGSRALVYSAESHTMCRFTLNLRRQGGMAAELQLLRTMSRTLQAGILKPSSQSASADSSLPACPELRSGVFSSHLQLGGRSRKTTRELPKMALIQTSTSRAPSTRTLTKGIPNL